MSLAPLVANGKVLIGTSGGELGIRGFIAAYDPDTGKELWRTYTVPAPGEPGSDTWPKGGDQWKTGGGSVWVTGNYDPETNLAYWGTGNGGPWMGDQRPGDNLYTSSTIAVDVATGQIKGHFQYTPNESFDWDEVSPPILVDFQRNGRTVKGLVDVARNGYMWFLDRGTGPIKFVQGVPYVRQTVFRGVDPVTGRPDVDPARKPGTGKTRGLLPLALGRKELAAHRLQPADAPGLRAREREPVRVHGRAAREVHARVGLHRREERDVHRAGRRSHRRSAGLERGHRRPARGPTPSPNRRTGDRCWRPAAGWFSAAARRTACSGRSMRARARCCGSTPPTPGSSASRLLSPSTAGSTSPCSRDGASTRAGCRTGSTPSARVSSPRCRKAEPCGCSPWKNRQRVGPRRAGLSRGTFVRH